MFIFKTKKSPFMKKLSFLWSTISSHLTTLVQKWTGELRRKAVMAKMKKADIILASPRTIRLSPVALLYRVVLKSHYIHSMLYTGRGKIIHTTSKQGVVVDFLPRKIYKKDCYTILRVQNLDASKRNQVVNEALKWQGKKLDFTGMITNIPRRMLKLQKKIQMDKQTDQVWCSKLLYKSFLKTGVKLVSDEKSSQITSEDLAHSPVLKKIL